MLWPAGRLLAVWALAVWPWLCMFAPELASTWQGRGIGLGTGAVVAGGMVLMCRGMFRGRLTSPSNQPGSAPPGTAARHLTLRFPD